MSDKKSPVIGVSRIRMQSQTERDLAGLDRLRRERESAEEEEAAPSDFASEEDSMAHEIPVRKMIRGRRDTKERLEKLEGFKDDATEKLNEISLKLADQNTAVARVEGAQAAQTITLGSIAKSLERIEHKEMLHVEADIDIKKAKKIELIKTAGAWREWVTKLLAIVSTGAAIVLALINAHKC